MFHCQGDALKQRGPRVRGRLGLALAFAAGLNVGLWAGTASAQPQKPTDAQKQAALAVMERGWLARNPAMPPDSPQTRILDPLEPVNRGMFRIDGVINAFLAGKGRILATAWWVPRPMREGLYNAFDNLDEPSTFANDLLQRKLRRAAVTAGRFGVNTTIGVVGVFDVASRLGLKRTREDFGQTLGMYGVTPGPYVYLPLSGPTSARDGLAGLVDGVFSPLGWVELTMVERHSIEITRIAVQPSTIGIRQIARAAADGGETNDEYATLRTLYYQQRAAQIADLPNLADKPISVDPDAPLEPEPAPPAPSR